MKTASIILMGKERKLCFSTRVVQACYERYGCLENLEPALDQENKGKALTECLWMLSQMMDAGERYCKRNGIPCEEALTMDDLLDCCGVEDFSNFATKIRETIISGNAASVETEPKNAEATQEA